MLDELIGVWYVRVNYYYQGKQSSETQLNRRRGYRVCYFRERGWENLVGGDKREGRAFLGCSRGDGSDGRRNNSSEAMSEITVVRGKFKATEARA